VIPAYILEMELPDGDIPVLQETVASPEENDAWQMENARLRWERGDYSRSDTPVNVMFEM